MKILYHGTLSLFTQIDLNMCQGYKDFGPGFYLSGVKDRAVKIALRNKNREVMRNKVIGKKGNILAYCYVVFFDESAFTDSNLNIKIFNQADLEWIKFLLANRSSKYKIHNYDIVIGPTADAQTVPIIQEYYAKYGKNMSDTVLSNLIKDLKPDVYPKQYYFGTKESLKYLKIQLGRRETL